MTAKIHPIIKRIERGEGMHLDFKFSISNSQKIAKSFVAFANSEGGSLLVGVKDCGKISGVVIEEERFMVKKAAQTYTTPRVSFRTKEWVVEGKKVLEVIIPESRRKPHFVLKCTGVKQSYVRSQDKNIMAPEIWVKMQKKRSSAKGIMINYSTLEKDLLRFLKEHPIADLEELSEALYLEKDDLNELLSDFWSMGIIKADMKEESLYFSL